MNSRQVAARTASAILIVGLARKHHLRPEALDRVHLDARRRLRHDDEGANPEPLRRERDALCMVPGR